jgi:hypothetical protein
MERHNLGDELFRLVNVSLEENGMMDFPQFSRHRLASH